MFLLQDTQAYPSMLWHGVCLSIRPSHWSFVRSIRGGGRLLAVFRRAFSHRHRWGLGLAQCTSPLTLGLYCIFIEPSLAGGFLWQGAKEWPSYRTASPCHLLSAPWVLTTPAHPDAPNPGVMACHIWKSTVNTGEPSVPPENNLIACRNLTRHADNSGSRDI